MKPNLIDGVVKDKCSELSGNGIIQWLLTKKKVCCKIFAGNTWRRYSKGHCRLLAVRIFNRHVISATSPNWEDPTQNAEQPRPTGYVGGECLCSFPPKWTERIIVRVTPRWRIFFEKEVMFSK
jgi:hypothetical protein